jgi:DNA-binding beta-propeller fold protein YncE
VGGSAFAISDADWLQVAGRHVWTTLSQTDGGKVQQFDGTSGQQLASVFNRGADTCTAMDQGYGSLWAAVCHETAASVLRIDPSTGKVVARIPLKGFQILQEGSVASAEGFVWVVTAEPRHRLVQIDPRTNALVADHAVPEGVVGARAGLGGLWLTDSTKGDLLRLDPRTAKVVATIHVGDEPRFFAVGEGAVWVQDNRAGTVVRVDPRTNSVTATVKVDDGPIDGGDLAVGGGYVWARVSSWLVTKVDPTAPRVVARYGPAAGSGSVAADETAVWVSAHDADLVFRLSL